MREIADLHIPFMAYCNKIGLPFHRARSDKKSTIAAGEPDFLCVWCSHAVYIECKVPGGKLSEAQEKRIAFLRKAGNKIVIAYSLQDCVEAVKDILCHGQSENAVQPIVESSDGQSVSDRESSKAGGVSSDLFLMDLGNSWGVYSGDPSPGGTIQKIRRATASDLANLPRR